MKRKPNPKSHLSVPQGKKEAGALPAKSKQLLKDAQRKRRVTISASQPHSKTFGR